MPVKSFPNIIGETDFGFTLGETRNFSEIITKTLRKNSHLIAQNVNKTNPLLLKIRNRDYFKINYIDPKIQEQRIIDRLHRKRLEKCVNPNNLLTAKEETFEEAHMRYRLENENRDKWDNKFVWYKGYEDIGQKIHDLRQLKEKV